MTDINVVIAGSSALQKEMEKWIGYWESKKGHSILDYPKPIPQDIFLTAYPDVHKNFFKNIAKADILFIANEKKNNIDGYIGAETFAELTFGLAQKLINDKKIKLILANMPSKKVACYDEIILWQKLGWIDDVMNIA